MLRFLLSATVVTLAAALALAAEPPSDPAKAQDGGQDSRRQEKREAREAMRAGDFDAPTTGWREGPVRYLLTRDQDQAYRRLATHEERARFIHRFWAGLDPDPQTPENEFRTLFYARVAATALLFTTESTKPGWKTDRGKIYILLGPPDDLDETALRQQEAEVITWTYRDPPAGTGASPNSQVRFVRDASGEYRLTSGFHLFIGETTMSVALATQALQVKSLPEARKVLDGVVDSVPPAAAGDFRLHADVFRAGDGLALVVLTLWIREDLVPAATAEVVGRLVGEGPDARTYDLAGARALRPGSGEPEGSPDHTRIFQGGVVVRPGRYSLYCAVAEPDTSASESFRDTLTVPPQGEAGLEVGPIGFAARLERLPDPAPALYVAPFILGRMRVVPRADSLFDTGEDLSFYYQVLGATTDPIMGRPDFDLEYRLFARGAGPNGSPGFRPFGRPIHLSGQQALLQGFALPIADWAAGEYRLQVTVTDNISGTSAHGETTFRVR
jgi:GWxTD domain-containing protein